MKRKQWEEMPTYYTPNEVAEELVSGISVKQIRAMCKAGEIEHICSGDHLKMTREAVLEGLKNATLKSTENARNKTASEAAKAVKTA